jgi:type I restriction enzyme, S subunit
VDAKTFVSEFGHIASAPGGVPRLRTLVQHLAATGKLVTAGQSILAEAKELVVEAKARKDALERAGEMRREQPNPSPAGVQADYPPTWVHCRLGQVVHLISGQHLKVHEQNANGEGVPYLTGASDFGATTPVITRWTTTAKAMARRGDTLISVKGTIGKTNVLDVEEAALGRQLMAVRALAVSQAFVSLVLRASEAHFLSTSIGIAIPGISRRDILKIAIGVPSLSEQHRIVAKVDELMTLCHKLEAQQQRRATLGQLARSRVFGVLNNETRPDEIAAAWRRVESNAAILIDSAESVQSYRGVILDLAVSGLLSPPQQTASSTGDELLALIGTQRAQWIKRSQGQEQKEALAMQRKARTQRVSPPAMRLPAHWAWGSMLQVAQAMVDCHNKTAPYVPEGIHLVRTTDIRDGEMDLRHTRKISSETYEYWARRLPPKAGDIFFTREAPMGEAAIVPDGQTVCLGQRTMLIRLFPELFNNRFLLYVIRSPGFQKRMVASAIGMTVKHLRVGGVEDLMVPVPPKDEQDRIVRLVDALFVHCDRLADQLSRKQQTAANLAQASVAAITGIRTEERFEMKAPKTELLSNLRLSGTPPAADETAPLAALLARNPSGTAAKSLWGASGLDIDAFYRQLKMEMAQGWIVQPDVATVREVASR